MINGMILLGLLIAVAGVILVYPFRENKLFSGCLLVVMLGLAIVLYQQWGAWLAVKQHYEKQIKELEARALLLKIKSPARLIERLRSQLTDSPSSAHGYYLLGRIYAGEGMWMDAKTAFAKAYQLDSSQQEVLVHYINSLWQLNHEQFNPEILSLLDTLLKKNPDQPDALAMLAMHAYRTQQWHVAIEYWKRLLVLVPNESKEAQALRKAIADAMKKT